MDELVGLMLQVGIELAIQLLGSSMLSYSGNSKLDRGCLVFGIHAFAGGFLGWLSTLVAPKLLLPHVELRLCYLIFAPVAAGVVSYFIAKWVRDLGNDWDPEAHAVHGVAFAFAFGAVRWAGGI